MSVKVTAWGGTDWIDGDILTATDLIGTLTATGKADASTIEVSSSKLQIKESNIPIWHLIETLSPSTASTITTTGTLTAYDEYMVQFNLTRDDAGATDNLLLRINADTGSNYTDKYINGTTNTSTGPNTSGFVCTMTNTHRVRGKIIYCGKTAAHASGTLAYRNEVISTGTGIVVLYGFWAGGNNTQITSLTFLRNGAALTFSGTIKVYGRNI